MIVHPKVPGWELIDTAPKDGGIIVAGAMSEYLAGWIPYPLRSRFQDGKWAAEFGKGWGWYEPQPTHWNPTASAPSPQPSAPSSGEPTS